MDALVKGFLGVFIFAMITYLCVGFISAQMDSSQARSYMDSAKQTIAESNFSKDAIEEAGTKAAANGYEMTITVYEKGVGKQTISYGEAGNGAIGDTSKINSVEMVMKYKYSIPILGVENVHTVRGYVN